MFSAISELEAQHTTSLFLDVTCDQVKQLTMTLKNGKAADPHGLAGEHIKYSHPMLEHLQGKIFNNIIAQRTVPTHFKHGVIALVFKQKRTQTIIAESILQPRLGSFLKRSWSRIQNSFSTRNSTASREASALVLPQQTPPLSSPRLLPKLGTVSIHCMLHSWMPPRHSML
jgi:hypothetical protein